MTKLPKVAHFLTLSDYSASQVQSLVTRSIAIKAKVQQDKPMPRFLEGKTLALLFTKRSTRTRVSSETGWASYGGYPLFLGTQLATQTQARPTSRWATGSPLM